MSVYRVLRASVYRNSGLLRVKVEKVEFGLGLFLEVAGKPEKCVQCRIMRPIYDSDDEHSMIIEPPGFPIDELIGETLVSKMEEERSPLQVFWKNKLIGRMWHRRFDKSLMSGTWDGIAAVEHEEFREEFKRNGATPVMIGDDAPFLQGTVEELSDLEIRIRIDPSRREYSH